MILLCPLWTLQILWRRYIEFETLLLKIELAKVMVEKKRLRNELKKDVLMIMRDCPELRNEMKEQLKRLNQEEEEDARIMALECEKNPQQAIQDTNQPAGQQSITN